MSYKNIELYKATSHPANKKSHLRCGVCKETIKSEFMYVWYFNKEPINNVAFCAECLFALRYAIDEKIGPNDMLKDESYLDELSILSDIQYPHFIPGNVLQALRLGKRVQAIKEWGAYYGCDLKTSEKHINVICALLDDPNKLWYFYTDCQKERYRRNTKIYNKYFSVK